MAHPLNLIPNRFSNYYLLLNQFHFFFQPQGASIDSHSHAYTAFSFAIPTLLNFLVLKYQNQEESPFETHPKTILFSISALLLYCLSYDYQRRLHESPLRSSSLVITRLVHHCTMFSGYMAVAGLASLLFTDSASPVVYVLYVAISVADLLFLLYQKMKTVLRLRGSRNLLPL